MTKIASFSGTHPYRPECVAYSIQLDWFDQGFDEDELARITTPHITLVTNRLVAGTCPRCLGPLDLTRTAGSRVTTCRCIPICPDCGSDEALQPALGRPMSRIWQWPISKGARTKRRNRWMANAVPAVIDVASNVVMDETGVGEIRHREHPGGWAEFGHDEEGDQ